MSSTPPSTGSAPLPNANWPEGDIDALAGRVLGMELQQMVRNLPAADILRAARELEMLPQDGHETLAERAAVVNAGRAALLQAADRLTALIMCGAGDRCCIVRELKADA